MPPTGDEMQRRLEELGENIEATREQAEKDELLPEDEPDEREPTIADPNPSEPGDEELPGHATG